MKFESNKSGYPHNSFKQDAVNSRDSSNLSGKQDEPLSESCSWCRTLTEEIPALITRVTPDGKVKYVNKAYGQLYSTDPEELVGEEFFNLVPEIYREKLRKTFSNMTPGDSLAVFEHQNRGRWYRWRNRAIYDEQGQLNEFFTIGEDITEYRTAEEELRKSEERNRAFVKALPDLIFRFDRDGKYLDVEIGDENRLTVKSQKLYREGKLIGSYLHDTLNPETVAELIRGIRATLDRGELQIVEYEYLVGGRLVVHEARMVPCGNDEVMIIVRDITARRQAEAALRASEERYREILSTIEERYYEADLRGTLTFCNEAACELFGGYKPEELIGTSYTQHYLDHQTVLDAFNRVYQTGIPEKGLVMEMYRKDRSVGFGEISIALIRDKDGKITGFKGIGKDVTPRIEYEKKLEFLSFHDQLTGIYNQAYFENELNRLNNSRVYPVTIISADLDGLKLVNDTMGHDAGDKLLKACSDVLGSSLRQSDVLARVGGDEFSALLPLTEKETGEDIVRRIKNKVNLYNRDHEGLPLGVSLGVATAKDRDSDLKALFKKADDMMYKDKLYRSSSSRSNIVQSLLAALAERDYITEGHARRLEALCLAVGEKVNLSLHRLSDLALLAQVHDLGKVGIPDKILLKPEPLSAEEWEIMATHPEKGYRIASSSPDLAGIADLILKHHERWDGSGYPLGIAGEEIPLECRILAIVDAYDAMTHQRPYNRIMNHEEALGEIKSNSGRQFDPALVEVFFEVVNKNT